MSTPLPESNAPAMDTRLRTLSELVARLTRPIPERLIDRKTDKSQADFVNITTMKDLLDAACGHANWRATVERVDCPGNHLGMIVRLWVAYDGGDGQEVWLWQDGTGHEVTDNPKIYGDPWTNAYAQALRRAAESFGMARELWRGEVIRSQRLAERLARGGVAEDLPKATTPDSPAQETQPVGDAPKAVTPQSEADYAALLEREMKETCIALGYDTAKRQKALGKFHALKTLKEKGDAVRTLKSLLAKQQAAQAEPEDGRTVAGEISSEERGREIAAREGHVKRDGAAYQVYDKLASPARWFKVTRVAGGKTVCECPQFKDGITRSPDFRCAHLFAVTFFVREQAKAQGAQ